MERFQERRARADEEPPEDDRAHDAPEQRAVLVPGGDGEGREEHREQEDVVHRERLLDEVPGEVLAAGRGAARGEDDAAEAETKRDPDNGPGGRFAHRHLVGVAVEDEQIKREHADEEHTKADPESEIK